MCITAASSGDVTGHRGAVSARGVAEAKLTCRMCSLKLPLLSDCPTLSASELLLGLC